MTEPTTLHIDAATVTESEAGISAQIRVVGNGRETAERLLPLMGQEVFLKTAGAAGRHWTGNIVAFAVKETKEKLLVVTVKVEGTKNLNELVGVDATVEAAQLPLLDPLPILDPPAPVDRPPSTKGDLLAEAAAADGGTPDAGFEEI
jgi:hypothetical protein